MIDLIQWRVCIGMWCGSMKSFKRKSRLVDNMQSHPSVKDYHWENNPGIFMNSHTSVWLFTLTVCMYLLLILSGDVESNPGPVG